MNAKYEISSGNCLKSERKKAKISEPSLNSRIKLDDCFVYGMSGQCWVRIFTAESGSDAESVCDKLNCYVKGSLRTFRTLELPLEL